MRDTGTTSRIAPWPIKRIRFSDELHEMKRTLRRHGLRSVCEDARCPNISECFGRRETTFMILGQTCTRRCSFCNIPTGRGTAPDPDEPQRLAAAVAELSLRHVVVTSVARDDLDDEGASHFVAVVTAIVASSPDTTVEVLTPDFHARLDCLSAVTSSPISIFNHNIETVERLQRAVRPQAQYDRSLRVLEMVKELRPDLPTKSGLMLGLGEELGEVRKTLADLRDRHVDIVTIGQYMQPRLGKADVRKYATTETFAELGELAKRLGFAVVMSGPYVRSSFGAAEAKAALEATRATGRDGGAA